MTPTDLRLGFSRGGYKKYNAWVGNYILVDATGQTIEACTSSYDTLVCKASASDVAGTCCFCKDDG